MSEKYSNPGPWQHIKTVMSGLQDMREEGKLIDCQVVLEYGETVTLHLGLLGLVAGAGAGAGVFCGAMGEDMVVMAPGVTRRELDIVLDIILTGR